MNVIKVIKESNEIKEDREELSLKKGIIAILSTLVGGAVGAVAIKQKDQKVQKLQNDRIDKFYDYFHLVNQWLLLKHEGKSLVQYFENNGYKNIAVYGTGELFSRLQEELRGSNINIVYGMDRKADKIYVDIEVLSLDDEWRDDVDAVVVTPIFMFDELEEMIMDRMDCPVVSLEEVVYGIE